MGRWFFRCVEVEDVKLTHFTDTVKQKGRVRDAQDEAPVFSRISPADGGTGTQRPPQPSELSKEFGCHTTSILSWVRQAGGSDASALPPANATALNAQERQELIELRRKLRQVQIERDILAKATAWFAAKSDKTFTPSTHS